MNIRLRKPLPAHVLLFVGFLGAFGFVGYYPGLHVAEAGMASVLVLFAWLALSTRISSRWSLYVFLPALGLALFVSIYAYVFTLRVDASLLPSLFAQRNYVFFLLAPIIYLLRLRGWGLADFRYTFVSAIFLAMLSRVVADFVLPVTSPTGELFGLRPDTAYEEQSHLLRRLDASILFSVLYFGRGFARSTNWLSFGFRAGTVSLAVVMLFVNVPRTLIASAIVAVVLYVAFFSRPHRARFSVLLLPPFVVVAALSLPAFGNFFAENFEGDLSYTTRVQSTRIAWDSFWNYPLLGFGQDSAQSVTYQSMFGEHFYPSDVGLLGVAFQWGLVGLFFYLLCSAWLFLGLLRLWWASTRRLGPRDKAFLWTLFVICSTFIITSPIQARFTKAEGLAIGAFSAGLLVPVGRGAPGRTREGPQTFPARAAEVQVARRP